LFGSKSHPRPAQIAAEQAGIRICHFIVASAEGRAPFPSGRPFPWAQRGEAMNASNLIRGFARVDSEGKIALPRNLRIAMGLKEKDLVELKLSGASKAKKVIMSKRQNYR